MRKEPAFACRFEGIKLLDGGSPGKEMETRLVYYTTKHWRPATRVEKIQSISGVLHASNLHSLSGPTKLPLLPDYSKL